jgi:hypothetical protein
MAGCALTAEQYPVQIDVHHPVELGEVKVDESAEGRSDSCVIEHDVQTAEVRHCEVDRALNIFRARHVCPLERYGLTHFVGNLLAAFSVEVSDDDLGPLFYEAIDGASSYAAGAPGDDSDLTNQ